jgi:hypothetical protein
MRSAKLENHAQQKGWRKRKAEGKTIVANQNYKNNSSEVAKDPPAPIGVPFATFDSPFKARQPLRPRRSDVLTSP